MRKNKNPNRVSFTCPNCGSAISVDDGYFKCSQSLLPTYDLTFREWQAKGDDHTKKMYEFSHSALKNMYDSWKQVDEHGNRPMFFCDYEPMKQFNPMTQSKVWMPDPIQQRIAETILDRKLNDFEYAGVRPVPLLDEEGKFMYTTIKQLQYPKDFTSLKDMVDKTDFEEMPVLFNLEELRAEYEKYRNDT